MKTKIKRFLVIKIYDDMKKAGFSNEKIDAEIDKWDYKNRTNRNK